LIPLRTGHWTWELGQLIGQKGNFSRSTFPVYFLVFKNTQKKIRVIPVSVSLSIVFVPKLEAPSVLYAVKEEVPVPLWIPLLRPQPAAPPPAQRTRAPAPSGPIRLRRIDLPSFESNQKNKNKGFQKKKILTRHMIFVFFFHH